jgi:hypothetical protein
MPPKKEKSATAGKKAAGKKVSEFWQDQNGG